MAVQPAITYLTRLRLLVAVLTVMVNSTTAVVGSVVKVSRTGVVVVAAGADVATVGMTAGRYWIASASPSSTPAAVEVVRPRMGMMVGDGRRW